MAKAKVLVVDGNTRETDEKHISVGGSPTGEHYARVLRSLSDEIECTVLHPARPGGAALPAGTDLGSFSGMAWTGSSLNVYNDSPAVRTQIELARAAFAVGVPQFGSCWGLQVAAVAAGGVVHPNPRGRELGIVRRITLTPAGMAHPMYQGRRTSFDAIGVHMDEVAQLPPGTTVLAGNDMSSVQAAEIRYQAGTCWATQYHPEYDFNEIAAVILRHGDRLIEAGFFADMPTLLRVADDLRALHADHTRKDLAWLYGVDCELLDPAHRRQELRRWLELQVLPQSP